MKPCKAVECPNEATHPDPRTWVSGVTDELVVCPKHLDVLRQWLQMMPPEWKAPKESR